LANRLRDPLSEADVEFTFPKCPGDEESEPQKLYASSTVLAARSDYYATSIAALTITANAKVFGSGFAEGLSQNQSKASESNPSLDQLQRPRVQVEIDDNFDLFHAILYYIYTNRITLVNDGPGKLFDILPYTAEEIYEIADRLLLDDLKKKSYEFLERTCSTRNITRRYFGKFAALYPGLKEIYGQFFRYNWRWIKRTPEYDEYFKELQGGEHEEDMSQVVMSLKDLLDGFDV
jgi:hypothetical protein